MTPSSDSREAPALRDLAADLQAAIVHHQAGRLDEAEALYRAVLNAKPGDPQVSHLLGILETQHGQPERGVELIRQAFPALATSPDLHVDLGNALRAAGKPEAAAQWYRRAIALKSDSAVAHANLAAVLAELGRFEMAISHCQTAIAIEPNLLPARITHAGILQAAGRLPEAAQAWREIIAIEPARAQSYHQLGGRLGELSLYKEALYCHDRAIALEPDNAAFHCSRGVTLMYLQDGEAAAAAFRRALELTPASKEGWTGLNWALRMLGRFEEADACIERLREIDPDDLRAVRHVPATGGVPEAGDIKRLAAVLDQSDAKPPDRITAGFALGRLLDEAGRFDEAFARYALANELVRRTWPRNGDSFDAQDFARRTDALIAGNTPQLLEAAAASGNMSELPVFVVGMPRSGTTLVEQICASHPQIFGAGERDEVPRIALNLARQRSDPQNREAVLRHAADAHVVRLHRLGGGALRVIDKMPNNVMLVGLIGLLFPRARVVYCSRDPRDISLSCYFQLFSDGVQYFSYDLADCGRRCRDVERLAAHWLALRPLHMIEMNYETLVGDLEGESRRLIEFLGLDWDPACLDFHRTERTVTTISHWQVRQPIYASSIGRWRHYEQHLGPLLAALGRHAPIPGAGA